MEAPDAGLELCPLDPQEVKGLGIDNVEAAAPVHEHHGEARVGDDGINDERVDPRIGDIVRLVTSVKSDGHLGPVKEEGGCKLYGEDLSMLALLLAHREARQGPPIDQEAIVDLGKPLVLGVVRLLGVLLLVVFLDAQAFEVPLEHLAVLKVVVGGSLVIGTRLFEHLVEDVPAGGLEVFCDSLRR
jgi:hypothetical protein